MRKHFIASCAALMLFTLQLSAPALAADAPDNTPELTKVFNSEDRTYFVLMDPLPHLTAILDDKALEATVARSRFAKVLQNPRNPVAIDFAAWKATLLKNSNYVPSEVAVAVPDHAWKEIDHTVRTYALVALCISAMDAGDKAIEAELPKAQAQLLEQLKVLKLPPMKIWVKFRRQEEAEMSMTLTGQALQGALNAVPDAVTIEDNRIHVRLAVSTVLPEEVWPQVLMNLKVVNDPASQMTQDLSKALASRTFEATLERLGSGLRLTIGEPPAGKGPLEIGSFAQGQKNLLFLGAWHLAEAKAVGKGLRNFWDDWSKTDTGKKARELDEEDIAGSLKRAFDVLTTLGDQGHIKVWIDKGLRAESKQIGVPPSKALKDEPWMTMIPADVESFVLDSNQSVPEVLAYWMDEAEGRLSLQSLRSGAQGEFAAEATAVYYKSFADFRNLVHSAAPLFGTSSAFLITVQGKVSKFDVTYMENDEQKRISLKDLPMMELASFSPVTDRAAAEKRLLEIYQSLAKGVSTVLDSTPPEPLPAVQKIDLGLGVPTFGFQGGWLATVTAKHKVTVEIEGDLQPHYFISGNVLVLSSSPRLSKQIVQSKQKFSLPKTDQPLIGLGRISSTTMAGYLTSISKWVATAEQQANPGRRQLRDLEETMGAFGDLITLAKSIDWTTVQSGATRTTAWELTFRPLQPPAPK